MEIGDWGWVIGIVILAGCKYHFIRVNDTLVQHPSNCISILKQSAFYTNIKILQAIAAEKCTSIYGTPTITNKYYRP